MKINRCCVPRIRIYVAPAGRRDAAVCDNAPFGSSVFLPEWFPWECWSLTVYSKWRDAWCQVTCTDGQWPDKMMDIGGQKRLENCTQLWPLLRPWCESRRARERETYKSRLVCFFSLEFFLTRALRNNWVRDISSRRLFIFTDLMMGGSFTVQNIHLKSLITGLFPTASSVLLLRSRSNAMLLCVDGQTFCLLLAPRRKFLPAFFTIYIRTHSRWQPLKMGTFMLKYIVAFCYKKVLCFVEI